MRNKLFVLSLALLSLAACGSHDQAPAVPVARVDLFLASVADADSAGCAALADSLRPELDAMFRVLGEPISSWPMYKVWSRSDVVRVFQPDVDSVFGNLDHLERQLGVIVERARRDSLGLPPLRFASVVWGRMMPVVRVDTVVLIALNHYLGADYEGYGAFNAFKRTEKRPEQIPYDIAGVLAATQHPMQTYRQQTLLSWMLYEGALVEARMRFVPDARLSMALGIDDDRLEMLRSHSAELWRELAARRLLYDTDPATIDRFLSAAPSAPLLGGEAPGRVGRFVGYEIVKAYLKRHPRASLAFLLSPEFYASQQSLIDSGYNGR